MFGEPSWGFCWSNLDLTFTIIYELNKQNEPPQVRFLFHFIYLKTSKFGIIFIITFASSIGSKISATIYTMFLYWNITFRYHNHIWIHRGISIPIFIYVKISDFRISFTIVMTSCSISSFVIIKFCLLSLMNMDKFTEHDYGTKERL